MCTEGGLLDWHSQQCVLFFSSALWMWWNLTFLFYFLLKEDLQDPGTYRAATGADSGNASVEDSQNQGMTGCPVQTEKLPRAIRQLVWSYHLHICRIRLA